MKFYIYSTICNSVEIPDSELKNEVGNTLHGDDLKKAAWEWLLDEKHEGRMPSWIDGEHIDGDELVLVDQ